MGLALPSGDTPLLAESLGSHDWLVAFLVDEDGQNENLNSTGLPAFSPCPPLDSDMTDEVLHFMDFIDVVENGNSVTNSRLVGGERIIHADGYVGTISREDEAVCDLNGDGDLVDRVFRWVLADRIDPTYENDISRLHALTDISGPANEVAEMGDRFVIVVNEITDGENHDFFCFWHLRSQSFYKDHKGFARSGLKSENAMISGIRNLPDSCPNPDRRFATALH